MVSKHVAPLVGRDAFDKMAQSYSSFLTPSDAMLASLLLSYEVPYRIMDLFMDVIKHPDFNLREVSLRSSFDILQVAEQARVESRLATVHRRACNEEGQMTRTKFPQTVLYEVLDILEEEREAAIFECVGDEGQLLHSSVQTLKKILTIGQVR